MCDTVNVMNLMVVNVVYFCDVDSALMLPFSCSHRPGVCITRPNCKRLGQTEGGERRGGGPLD